MEQAPLRRKSSTVCDRCTRSPFQRELVAINEVGGAMVLLLRSGSNEHARFRFAWTWPPIFPKSPRNRVQLAASTDERDAHAIEAMKDTAAFLRSRDWVRTDESKFLFSDTGPGLPWVKPVRIIRRVLYNETGRQRHGPGNQQVDRRIHGGRSGPIATGGRGATFHFSCQCSRRRQTLPRMPHDSPFSRVGT